MWSLKSPLKMVAFFCMNPVQSLINSTKGKCKFQQKRYYQWLVVPHEFFLYVLNNSTGAACVWLKELSNNSSRELALNSSILVP